MTMMMTAEKSSQIIEYRSLYAAIKDLKEREEEKKVKCKIVFVLFLFEIIQRKYNFF